MSIVTSLAGSVKDSIWNLVSNTHSGSDASICPSRFNKNLLSALKFTEQHKHGAMFWQYFTLKILHYFPGSV